MAFWSSLRLTTANLATFLALLLADRLWLDFPRWLYVPPLLIFYANLGSCLLRRLRTVDFSRWRQAGFILFHAGLAVIGAGALITALLRFEGGMEVAVGQSFRDRAEDYLWQDGAAIGGASFSNAAFRLKEVLLVHHPDETIRELDCAVAREGGDGETFHIRKNHPLPLGGGKVYVTNFHGSAIRFQAIQADGRAATGSVHFAEGQGQQSFQIPGLPHRLEVEFGRSKRDEILLRGFPGFMARKLSLQPGEAIPIDGLSLKYVAIVPWVSFTMVRDPGQPYIYAGFILLALGLCMYYPAKIFKKRSPTTP